LGARPPLQTCIVDFANQSIARDGLKAITDYEVAYNEHDAVAVSSFRSPEAIYLNRFTGEEIVGRNAISQQFFDFFTSQPQSKLSVSTESIEFISPNVAIERGVAKLEVPKSEPDINDYVAVYVKREGMWLLDRVTDETPKIDVPSRYEQLKVLEWLIGVWVDQDEDVRTETTCNCCGAHVSDGSRFPAARDYSLSPWQEFPKSKAPVSQDSACSQLFLDPV
jgi:uncharacterized protein (TIGR02246 family)